MKEWMMAHPWMFFFIVLWGITMIASIIRSVAAVILGALGYNQNKEGE